MTPGTAPSVEEQLRDALHEVAETVTLDALPVMWPDNGSRLPRGRRTRMLTAVIVAAALAAGAVAVAVVNATRSTESGRPASTTPTSPLFVNDGPLIAPRFYRNGLIVLLPPGMGARPHVTAKEAYAARSGYPWRREPPSPHLVLADVTIFDYGIAHNDGSVTPLINHRLAWVVTYTNAPVGSFRSIGGKPRPRGSDTIPTRAVDPAARSGETVLIFVDATSGSPISAEGVPGTFSTAPALSCPTRAPLGVPSPEVAGTDSTFIPGGPIELLACRYHGLNQPQPARTLAKSARLAPHDIVGALNAQPLIPKGARFHCPADFGEKILLLFGYADGSRLTASIGTTGCQRASNGDHVVHTPPATLAQLQDVVGLDLLHS